MQTVEQGSPVCTAKKKTWTFPDLMHFNAYHVELIEIYIFLKKKPLPAYGQIITWDIKIQNVKIIPNGVLRLAKW